MAIQINGNGTITGISVGGLPDGIVDTDMIANNAVTNAKATGIAGGKVLQVVGTSSSTNVTVTDEVDLLSLSITPSATSSKVFIIASVFFYVTNNGNAIGSTRIYRGSSSSGTLLIRDTHGTDSNQTMYTSYNPNILDSPNTTSATTYTLQIDKGSGNTNQLMTLDNPYSLTAMEIGA